MDAINLQDRFLEGARANGTMFKIFCHCYEMRVFMRTDQFFQNVKWLKDNKTFEV